MSTTTPRFTRQTARGYEQELAAPLPTTLAALVADRSEQHGKVAARLAELRGRRVELARQLAEQEAADERAAADAAAAGRSPGRRQKAASIRKRLEETETELAGFEDGIAKSADSLLAAAAPHRKQAVEKATEAQTAAIARAQELLAAADAALAEAGTLVAERSWLARLDGRQRIEPFRPVSGDPSLGQLRAALRDAFADWRDQHDRRQADFDQRRAYEAEQEAQRVRHDEQARREDAARRVVTAGGAIVEQGGRPVRQTGFGLAPVEDEEQPVSFERLSPVERVAVAEAHLAQLELPPGSPRLGVATLERLRIVKLALADDDVSDERVSDLLADWGEHLRSLDPDVANAARDALTEFGRIVDGLRGPAGQEDAAE